jgi:regulator of protease activity HflC (stomatin/prohibitin superfamily)
MEYVLVFLQNDWLLLVGGLVAGVYLLCGIHIVIAVELRDVKITDESIQEAIALKARAAKEAEAEMVRAEAQVAIAKELSLAAKELTTDGWRLKAMETTLELCRSAENNTILVPTELLHLAQSVLSK